MRVMPLPPPIVLPAGSRILVVTLRRIGDALLTTPLIRSLRRAWPDAKIDVLAYPGPAGIIEGNPDVDRVIVATARPTTAETAVLVLQLFKRYHLAVSTQPGDRPTFLALLAGRTHAGLIDADGRPTSHGQKVARLPVSPRLGHMLVAAGDHGWGRTAAEVAVLLSEQGLGGNDPDLETRIRRWRSESGRRAEAGRGLAQRWAKLAGGGNGEGPVGGCVALAFPDRVSRRRGADGADWIAVGGRGFRLDPASSLAREEWLAVAETQGAAAGARILSGARVTRSELEDLFRTRIENRRSVEFDPASGAVRAIREQRLGAIRLVSGPDSNADPAEVATALVEGVRTHGLTFLPWPEAATALRQRAQFVGGADLSDEALIARLDEWLPALVEGKRKLGDINQGALFQAIENLIGWEGKSAIDRQAPSHFTSPLGTAHLIDYGAEGGPAVELRVQALFGLSEHPMIGSTPLVLRLTSPAGRPIQTTRDLPGFWKGSWAAVAKEMRGRYPRHPWPDDPIQADPTLRTKKATQRQG